MTDDIVDRLRNSYGQGCTCFAHHSFECSCVGAQWVERCAEEAADEIERLRTAGDALARVATGYWLHPDEHNCSEVWNGLSYDCECGMVWSSSANVCPSAEAVRAWQEVRRG